MTNAQLAGTGIGLRGPHLQALLREVPPVPWLELLADNYLALDEQDWEPLRQLRGSYPLALHAVGISLAGPEPLDRDYLQALRRLADHLEITEISDHLCWTGLEHRPTHDLLPAPYTPAALEHIASRVMQVSEILARPLLVENISAYVDHAESCMEEGTFIAELARRSGCRLLVDVNNLYVNQENLGSTARAVVEMLPTGQIGYVHVAGHRREPGVIIDSHDRPVCSEVLDLLAALLRRAPDLPVLLEWDYNLPGLPELLAERERVAAVRHRALERQAA